MPYTSKERPSANLVDEEVWWLVFDKSCWLAFCKICQDETGRDPYACKKHENTATHCQNNAYIQQKNHVVPEKLIPSTFVQSLTGTTNPQSLDHTPTKTYVAATRFLESFLPPDIPRTQLPDIRNCYSDQYTSTSSDQEFLNSYPWEDIEEDGFRLQETEAGLAAMELAEAARQWHLGPDELDSDDDMQEIEIEPEIHLAVDPDNSDNEEEALGRKRPRTRDPETDKHWFPWMDKLSCTLDLLMHLPRSVFSERQLELFMWLLKVNSIDGVPSVKRTKDANQALQDLYGIQTYKYKGTFGHVYYVNSLADIISQELSNPKVRPKLHFYPEAPGSTPFSQVRQGNKWLNEMPDDLLTPMIRLKRGSTAHQDFFIFEPAMLRDGRICMPYRWIRRDNQFIGRCWNMKQVLRDNGTQSWRVLKNEHIEVGEDELMRPFPELKNLAERGYEVTTEVTEIDDYYEPRSDTIEKWNLTDPKVGNPWRIRAKGHRCLAFPIWLYCDDTSGNISKRWNEHNSYLFTPAGLDRSESSREFNIHFLCTSNCAPPLEMLDGIVDQLCDGQEHGVWAWDIEVEEPVLLLPSVLALLGDNPMQSEFACHIGLRGKFFCRSCQAKGKDAQDGREEIGGNSDTDTNSDGPDDGDDGASVTSATSTGTRRGRKTRKHFVETIEAMETRVKGFIAPGTPREREQTLKTLERHFHEAQSLPAAGTSDTRCKNLRKEAGIKDTYQMYFVDKLINSYKKRRGAGRQAGLDATIDALPERTTSAALNPHSDTPVEVLHVILLGFVKYLWRDVMRFQVKDNLDKKSTVTARLSSIWVEGLGLDSLIAGSTLVTYYGSLTGGDFRKLAQVAPFVLHGLVSSDCYNTWIALSKLIPLIWQPQIDNLEDYLRTLTSEIQNFLVLAAKWSIRWFNKPKFHILVHLPDHIRRYGPAILFATETFESFNAVIREKSTHSNRHAPSHDLAVAFAAGNRVRHFTSGGKFLQSAEVTELCSEKEKNAAIDFEDVTLPQSKRVTRIQRYFRNHQWQREHWRSIGPGPVSVLTQSTDTIGRYLGLAPTMRDKMKARKVTCTFDKAVKTCTFLETETGRRFPDLDIFTPVAKSSKRFRVANEVYLETGDRCSVSTEPILRRDKEKFSSASPFVIVRVTNLTPSIPQSASSSESDTSSTTSTLHVARMKEILQYLGDRPTALAINPDCLLAQIYDVSHEPSASGMPRLVPNDKYVVLKTKNVLCTVNVQHDCIRNECKVKEIHFRRQERHLTSIRKGAVEHEGNLYDLVLNTAQMRARYVQCFRIPPTLLDVNVTLMESIKKEVDTRKGPPRSTRFRPRSAALNPPPPPVSNSPSQVVQTLPQPLPAPPTLRLPGPSSTSTFPPSTFRAPAPTLHAVVTSTRSNPTLPHHWPMPSLSETHHTRDPFDPQPHWIPHHHAETQFPPGTPYSTLQLEDHMPPYPIVGQVGRWRQEQDSEPAATHIVPHTQTHSHFRSELFSESGAGSFPSLVAPSHQPRRPSSLRQTTVANWVTRQQQESDSGGPPGGL